MGFSFWSPPVSEPVIPEYWPTKDVFWVSPEGDNSDGLSPLTALHNPNDVMSLVSQGDIIIIQGNKTYNVNDTKDGWVHDKTGVDVYSVGGLATITNTDTNDDGAALTLTGSSSTIRGLIVSKGEIASANSCGVRYDGALRMRMIDSIATYGNNATHRGVIFDGGAAACAFLGERPEFAVVSGTADPYVGYAVYFGDAIRCYLSRVGAGLAERIIVYSADALNCSTDKDSLLQGGEYGFYLEPGADQCISDGKVENVSIPLHDLSGNSNNYPRGEIVHVVQTLNQNAGSHTVNLARVEGTIEITLALGFVVTSPSNATAVYLTLENGGAPIPVTKVAGAPPITGVEPGTTLIKELSAAEILGVYDAATQQLIESTNRAPSVPWFAVQENGASTYIAVNFTTADSPMSGEIEWHFDWKPKSDSSGLYPLV